MGGGLKIFGPRRSPTGKKSGGGDLRKKSDWSQNCRPNAKLGHFCYFKLKHEIQLFKALLSLKVVKFDTKMYLNFSNFRGRTLAGGDKPWSKNGDKCRMGGGGIDKIFAGWGPPVPQEKNPGPGISLTTQTWFIFCLFRKLIFQLETMNKVRKSMESWICFHFTIISFTILFLKQQGKINSPFGQTYSCNKGGLKLFLFQEYEPMGSWNFIKWVLTS